MDCKTNKAGHLISPYFKELYLYLVQNKLPSTKTSIHKVEMLAEKYMLLDSLLFKLVTDEIITVCHFSLFIGHHGVIDIFDYWR